jgi:hypothetical protein
VFLRAKRGKRDTRVATYHTRQDNSVFSTKNKTKTAGCSYTWTRTWPMGDSVSLWVFRITSHNTVCLIVSTLEQGCSLIIFFIDTQERAVNTVVFVCDNDHISQTCNIWPQQISVTDGPLSNTIPSWTSSWVTVRSLHCDTLRTSINTMDEEDGPSVTLRLWLRVWIRKWLCLNFCVMWHNQKFIVTSRVTLWLEHIKIETRLIDERLASVMGECVILTPQVNIQNNP